MAQGTWKVDSNKNKKLQEASRPWWDMPGVKDWWDDFTSDVKHRKPMSMKEMNPNSTPKAAVELMTKYNAAENKTIFGQNKPVRIPYTSKEHGAGTLYISSQTNGEVKFNPTELNQPSYDRTKAQLQALGIAANLPAIVAPVVSGIAGRANIRANLNLQSSQRSLTNALQIATSKPTNTKAFYSGLPPQRNNRINSNLVAQAKQLRKHRGKQAITPKVTNPDPPTIRQLKRELKKADTRIEKGSQVKKNRKPSTKVSNNPDLSIFKPKTGKGISDDITPKGKDIEIIYGVTKDKKQIPHPEQRPLSGDVDLHHKVGKDIRFDFTTQARKLDPKGQAALDDIDAEYGLQSGSGADALTPYNKIPHNRMHNSEKRFLNTKDSFMSGNEPSGRFLKELRNDIAGASSLKELKKLYRDYIERSALPFNEKARLFQRAYEKAGTPKRMTEAELKILAKLQKNQELSKSELKIERLMERAYSKP